jgi:biopolymer transport protein ExbD
MAALLPILVVFLACLQWLNLSRFADYVPEGAIAFEFPSLPAHSRINSPDTLSIDIHADGTVSIAGVLSEPPDSADLPVLRQHLRSVRRAVNRHGGLIVRPDPEAQFQRLIDVLSAVTGSGILFYGLT